MTRPLFEQYKDALRRGHLAARALRVDEALAAYAEAAALAPDRAAPHASRATLLHRAGRDPDAMAAFERALQIAPDDEATLRARAAVHHDLGRLASAAADLEHLAEALDADGRRADALAAAHEAVALTATPARRALVARLEQPEDDTLPRARRIERPAPAPKPGAPKVATATSKAPTPAAPTPAAPTLAAPTPAAPTPAAPTPAAATPAAPSDPAATEPVAVDPGASEPGASPTAAASSSTLLDLYDSPIEGEAQAPPPPGADPIDGADVSAPTAAATEPQVGPVPGTGPIGFSDEPPGGAIGLGAEATAAPRADDWSAPAKRSSFDIAHGIGDALIQLEEEDTGASIPWPAIDLPSAPPPPIVGPPPDPESLMAEALSLIDGGDPKAARNLMLTAVMVHRAAGRPDAALDVCLQLLALAPGDAHVHLAIAGLQLDRGWRALATDKIQLLLRLTALTGDTQAEADAHALAAERLRDELPSSLARA